MARTKAKYTRWKVFRGCSDGDGDHDHDYDGFITLKDGECSTVVMRLMLVFNCWWQQIRKKIKSICVAPIFDSQVESFVFSHAV